MFHEFQLYDLDDNESQQVSDDDGQAVMPSTSQSAPGAVLTQQSQLNRKQVSTATTSRKRKHVEDDIIERSLKFLNKEDDP